MDASDGELVARTFARLTRRERALLWLAYAQGSSHKEIASCLGVRTASVKLLLFRARRKMAALLEGDRSGKGARS
jgi:RNA polymerase sigma-70 factor (ECF subfamily)